MEVDDILAKQVEHLEREKRELQDKLKSQEKKVRLTGDLRILPIGSHIDYSVLIMVLKWA